MKNKIPLTMLIMDYQLLSMLILLQITTMYAAPLQLQQSMHTLQQPIPMQAQEALLQRQLMALQQMQALKEMNNIHAPSALFLPQPMLILLPNPPMQRIAEINDVFKKVSEHNVKDNYVNHNTDKEHVDEDLESVIIEAEPNEPENQTQDPPRAILLVPSSRLSIGDFISSIPWLPFEVNVPDTISWAYNGISNGIAGIISIIGQRLPFRPRPANPMMQPKGTSLNMFLKQLQKKKQNSMAPVMILPFDRAMLPTKEITMPVGEAMIPVEETMLPFDEIMLPFRTMLPPQFK